MATPSDYYQLMGVPTTASPQDIKRAHRTLARKYHPDVSKEPDAEAQFKRLGEAYDVLKDPQKRAAYDRWGAHWKEGLQGQAPPPPRGADSHNTHNTHGTSSPYDEQSDLFEHLFRQGFTQQAGQGRAQAHRFDQQGQDRHARIEIALEDAYAGATRRLVLSNPGLDPLGHAQAQERTIEFKVPIGIRAGQHIRLVGQGWPGTGGGQAGDLFLDVVFLPHPLYRIDHNDVLLDLPISPWEAALGAELEVPTPGGPVSLSIPPGARQGKKLRLRGKGLPAKVPGDFYFVLQLVNPPAHSEAEKAVYQQMAEQFKAFNPRTSLGAHA